MEYENGYVIKAMNLRKTFGEFVAVDDISFDLLRGECLGLLGPNGAGKTSTVRMVYGFSPMTSGSLRVFGIDMRTGWRAIRANTGVCQQENNLDPDLSVLENLELYARYFDIPKRTATEKARRLLDFIGLDQRKDERVTSLSGGMVRRLILVRALINDPKLLILDEPTTGLDPQSRHQIWERLEGLRAEGLSILVTTHNMDEASRLCSDLIIMDRGRIVVRGDPAQLIRDHAGRYVLEAIDPSDELRTYVRDRGYRHDGLDRRLIVYSLERDRIFEEIGSRFCNQNCTQRMATLEDVFLRLTGRDLRE